MQHIVAIMQQARRGMNKLRQPAAIFAGREGFPNHDFRRGLPEVVCAA
jgi:hypothetical protein